MNNVLILLFCLAVGAILRASGRIPSDGHKTINAFIINISLPALALLQIPRLPFSSLLLIPISMPWLMFTLVAATMWIVGKRLKLRRTTTGALILTAGLANTSFMGVPMIEAFYGRTYTGIGLLIDQLGTYLVLSTLGLAVACLCSQGIASAGDIARQVATFPPLIALVVAVALAVCPIAYPPVVTTLLERLAATLAPLALVSVGLQLRLSALKSYLGELSLGLSIKLVAAPMLFVLLYVWLAGVKGDLTRVMIFEAAMGPQIGGAIVATQYGLDPPLVTLMVGIGTLAAIVSLPAWWYLLQFI